MSAVTAVASGVGLGPSASAVVPPEVNNIANQPIIAAALGPHGAEAGPLIADVAPHDAAADARREAALADELQRLRFINSILRNICVYDFEALGSGIVGGGAGWVVGSSVIFTGSFVLVGVLVAVGVYKKLLSAAVPAEGLSSALKITILVVSILAGIGVGFLLTGGLITPAGLIIGGVLIALRSVFLDYYSQHDRLLSAVMPDV